MFNLKRLLSLYAGSKAPGESEVVRNHYRPKIISNTRSNSFITQGFPPSFLQFKECLNWWKLKSFWQLDGSHAWVTGRDAFKVSACFIFNFRMPRQLKWKQSHAPSDMGLGINPVRARPPKLLGWEEDLWYNLEPPRMLLFNELTSLQGLSERSRSA